jgi:hypothetical protein
MAETGSTNYERKLRQQLRGFLNNEGPHHAILSALYLQGKKDWRPFLFGGVLRDILILGLGQGPRDIDVVIANGSSEELVRTLHPYIRRHTRFGGFQLELRRWHFDIWPLQTTWAFLHDRNLAPTPENLPKTTFLNVEAVAVELGPHGEIGEIIERGFFEAVRLRTLDINFEENPYPALAAVRSLATASKLRYSISPRLGRYILETKNRVGSEALVAAQDSHYGFVRFRSEAIQFLTEHIDRELGQSPTNPLRLPDEGHQLPLWENETTA